MGDRQDQLGRDFFVSYTKADQAWAEWIAWELEAVGYTTLMQAWDMPPGTAFVHEMDQAVQTTERTVVVLSPAYLKSEFGEAEWRPGFRNDPSGDKRKLIPVRIEQCEPPGLLGDRVWIDLVGLDEAEARDQLVEQVRAALRGHSKPDLHDRPRFPPREGRAAGVAERPRFPTALPPVWNVPFRRNRAFTGRHAILERLAGQLHGGTDAVTQAVHGSGGIGKTATAVEYTYRYRTAFDTVWWVRGEEPTTLVGDYAGLAAARGLPDARLADQHQVALAVRRWLDAHDRWLLVLDNAEGPTTATGLAPPLARLVDLLPIEPRGQVLITSRDATWRRDALVAELDLFTRDEAVGFLLVRADSHDQQAALKVAELLGLLPLALEQAGAYVEETGISLGDYLERLRQFPALMLTEGEPRDRDPTDTVATTWKVSVERVRPVPGALVLLELAAFLAPEDIPRELFAKSLNPPAAELAELVVPVTLDRAVGALRRYGLVKVAEGELTIHRLLQQVIRDGLNPETAGSRVGLVVRLLAEAFPWEGHSDTTSWPVCARLLSHALVTADHAERQKVESAATAELLRRAGNYLGGRGRYEEGRLLLERGVALAEATFRPQDERYGLHLNTLGYLLLRAGKTAAAKENLERGLLIQEAAYGPDHPEVATILDNLGQVLYDQGDLEGARQHEERALTIKQAALGPDHPVVGITLGNLGQVLRNQGDLEGARQHLGRSCEILSAALGPQHPSTLHAATLIDLLDQQSTSPD